MKWYSIKDFMPQLYVEYIVVIENNDIYLARLESYDDLTKWQHQYYCDDCESNSYEDIYGVTHFCIIEPVPIVKLGD